ncbi:hypothetical protein [Bradyrhizobium diazoefficiens]
MSWSDEARAYKLKYDVALYLRGRTPAEIELRHAPLIDEWIVAIHDQSVELFGLVAGKRHRTSRLIWLDRNFRWARTEDAVYSLGRPTNVIPGDI